MTYGSFGFTQDFVKELIEQFVPKTLDGVPRYGKIRTTELYNKIKKYFPEDVNQIQITRMLKKCLGVETVRYPEGFYLKTDPKIVGELWKWNKQFTKHSVLQISNGKVLIVELPQELYNQLYGSGSDAKDTSMKATAPDKITWGVDHSKDKELLELGTIPEIQEEELLPVEEITAKTKPSTTTTKLQQKRQESL